MPLSSTAFRAIPRHLFIPRVPLEQVYQDKVIVTKEINGIPASSCEQSAIVAVMLEQLGLGLGQRVLEIGAGTGHTPALNGHLASGAGLRVRAYPLDREYAPSANEIVIKKRWTQLVLDWPG